MKQNAQLHAQTLTEYAQLHGVSDSTLRLYLHKSHGLAWDKHADPYGDVYASACAEFIKSRKTNTRATSAPRGNAQSAVNVEITRVKDHATGHANNGDTAAQIIAEYTRKHESELNELRAQLRAKDGELSTLKLQFEEAETAMRKAIAPPDFNANDAINVVGVITFVYTSYMQFEYLGLVGATIAALFFSRAIRNRRLAANSSAATWGFIGCLIIEVYAICVNLLEVGDYASTRMWPVPVGYVVFGFCGFLAIINLLALIQRKKEFEI